MLKKDDLKNLIRNNRIKEVIKDLVDSADEINNSFLETKISLISAEYNELEEKQFLGIESFEKLELRRNKIIVELLFIIESLQNEEVVNTGFQNKIELNGTYKTIRFGCFFVIIFIGFFLGINFVFFPYSSRIDNNISFDINVNEGEIIDTLISDDLEIGIGMCSKVEGDIEIGYDLKGRIKNGKIKMNGEVFFDINNKDESQKLTIFSPHFVIEVIGTTFIVNDFDELNYSSIIVLEGALLVMRDTFLLSDLDIELNRFVVNEGEEIIFYESIGIFKEKSFFVSKDDFFKIQNISEYIEIIERTLLENQFLLAKYYFDNIMPLYNDSIVEKNIYDLVVKHLTTKSFEERMGLQSNSKVRENPELLKSIFSSLKYGPPIDREIGESYFMAGQYDSAIVYFNLAII